MAKKRGLTPKQRAFVREKIKDPTISTRKAMRNAGYAEATIQGVGHSTVPKRTEGSLRTAMEKAGLTEDLMAKRLKQVCMAKKKTTEDFYVSRAGLELAAKLRGDITTKVEHSGTIGEMSCEEAEEMLAGLKRTPAPKDKK